MKRVFTFLLFFFFYCTFSQAQNVVFSAEASANTIGIDDQIQVTFTLQNVQELQGIQNPTFPGFNVLAGPIQSQSSSYTFNGNQQVRSSTLSFTYVLQASRTGTLTIPPITAKDGSGRVYQCNPLNIRVENGSLAPKRPSRQQQATDPFGDDDPFSGGNGGGDPFEAMRQHHARMQQLMQQMMQAQQGGNPAMAQNLPEVSEKDLGNNIFVRVNVDRTKVNLGEQITVTYKMYTRVAMQAGISKLPSLNGFWTQDFDLPKEHKPQLETLNGIQYNTFTLKKSALFPQQTGTLVLDAAEIRGVARIADRYNPYGKDIQFKLKSTPVNITVTPLPIKDQPENFGGAVGSFTLNSSIDKTNLSTDESANLTLNISGTGNLKLIQAPILNLPNGLDAFEPTIVDTITGRSTTISGNKIFTYAIAPRLAGDYEIPAIPFSFYNSRTGTYNTLFTKPVKIHVTQGKNDKKDLSQQKVLTDIHDINKDTFKSFSYTGPLFFSGFYWMLYAAPLLALIVFILWKKKTDKEAGNKILFKNKYANKIALKRLKTAKVYMDNKQTIPFYEEISKAIWLYLSDKLHIPLSQLSKETASEALRLKNISAAQSEKMNRIIEDCAMSLYAPSGAAQQMNHTYLETVQLIGELEETLKK